MKKFTPLDSKNSGERFIRGFFFALLLVPALAVADFSASNWLYKKEIVPATSGGTKAFGEVVFDNELFSKANQDLSDVRILDKNGSEVPYVLVTEAPQTGSQSYSAQVLNKGFVKGEYTSFIVDLGQEGVVHNLLNILTDTKNFRRTVRLEGSSDQSQWLTLVASTSIYDYSLEFNAQNTSMRYPDTTMRYLRVTILDNGETPLSILGARVVKEVANAAKEVSYTAESFTQTEDAKKRASLVTIDLGAKGLPTSKLEIQTSDTNFNREVALYGSNDQTNWSPILSHDVIFSYATPAFTGSKLVVPYSESNNRYLQLIIFNKDDKPIHVSSVHVSGLLRKLVFEYDPATSYSVYYGNSGARFPEYDLKNYLSYFDSASRRALSLGGEMANPTYVPPPPPPPPPLSEQYPYVLLVALLLAVGVVGFLTIRLLKKAKDSAKQ